MKTNKAPEIDVKRVREQETEEDEKKTSMIIQCKRQTSGGKN